MQGKRALWIDTTMLVIHQGQRNGTELKLYDVNAEERYKCQTHISFLKQWEINNSISITIHHFSFQISAKNIIFKLLLLFYAHRCIFKFILLLFTNICIRWARLSLFQKTESSISYMAFMRQMRIDHQYNQFDHKEWCFMEIYTFIYLMFLNLPVKLLSSSWSTNYWGNTYGAKIGILQEK